MLKTTKYSIIYADPPWNGLGWNNGGQKCPANHYQVQDLEWIKNIPVKNITDTNAVLFLWVTMPNLEASFEVIKAWGFKYSTCGFTWVKRNKNKDTWFTGCGNYTRANTELCLLCTKGSMQKAVKSHKVKQICDSKIEKHSKKPDEIRDRIVELFGDLPRIELFAREKVIGWDSIGFDVDGKDIYDSIKDL